MSTPHLKKTSDAGLPFLLSQIGAHVAATFAEQLQPLKISPAHAGILRIVRRQHGVSQQSLAKLLGMFPSRLVLLLDELEEMGLVERKASETDRRIYALHLTARGDEKLEMISRVSRDLRGKLCASLTESERETLADLLAKIAEEQGLTPGVHPGFGQIRDRQKRGC
jgi:DNA-binding MarR family transcriptional regulator